jgi:hypothetical protein
MVRKGQIPRIVMTRMPEGLHARLRKEAKLNKRSVNGEIIHRLVDTFAQTDEEAEFHRRVDAAAKMAAKTIAAALGPAVLARLENVITTEGEIFESALKEEPASESN